jgi:hypothetical protein
LRAQFSDRRLNNGDRKNYLNSYLNHPAKRESFLSDVSTHRTDFGGSVDGVDAPSRRHRNVPMVFV